MIVERNQIFNLMDTNGRRSDVLNALKIYRGRIHGNELATGNPSPLMRLGDVSGESVPVSVL